MQDPKNPCLKIGVDTPKPGGVVGPEQQPMQRGKKRTTSHPKHASARKVARQGPRVVQVSSQHCTQVVVCEAGGVQRHQTFQYYAAVSFLEQVWLATALLAWVQEAALLMCPCRACWGIQQLHAFLHPAGMWQQRKAWFTFSI